LKKIKVVLADMPPLLRDIVRDAVADQLDMEVVTHAAEKLERPEARAGADVVILGASQPDDPAAAAPAFGPWAGRKVLAIALNGRSATLWQLLPHKVQLGDVSAQSLIDAIRGGVPKP